MREKDKIYKDPNARLDYYFDWEKWLLDDDIIASAEVSAVNCVVESKDVRAKGVVVWVTGGEAGQSGSITCHIVTTNGRTDDRTMNYFFKHR